MMQDDGSDGADDASMVTKRVLFFFIDQDAVVVHLVNHTLFSDLLVRLELLVFLQFAMVLWLL